MFLELLNIYEKEIRKNTKNKRKVYLFEIYKMSYIKEIENILESSYTYSCKYQIFLIFEPKVRVVMSLPIKDKVLNHYVTRYILIPKLEKYLNQKNVATRKDMGVELARKLFKKYLSKMKSKIVNSKEGITFLGIHYKIKKNKIVEFLPNKKKQTIRKKIKKNFLNLRII